MTNTLTIRPSGDERGGPKVRRSPAHSSRSASEEPPTPVGRAAKGLTIGATLAVVLVPLWIIVLPSFSTPGAINRAGGLVLWPDGLTTASYVQMLEDSTVLSALIVSLGITVVGTAVSMVVSILCAYGLSRPRSLGHRFVLLLLIVTSGPSPCSATTPTRAPGPWPADARTSSPWWCRSTPRCTCRR